MVGESFGRVQFSSHTARRQEWYLGDAQSSVGVWLPPRQVITKGSRFSFGRKVFSTLCQLPHSHRLCHGLT